MASIPPPSVAPQGVPPSGNAGKVIAAAVVLLGIGGGFVAWKRSQEANTVPVIVTVDAAPSVAATASEAPRPPPVIGRNLDDEVPLPPPVVDASAASSPSTKPAAAQNAGQGQGAANGCEVKRCPGSSTPELEKALSVRASQSRQCYNDALAQDPSLRGKLSISVRIASNGSVCSSSVAGGDLPSAQVGQCVAARFRNTTYPAPVGGCIDATVPLNFIPKQ